MPDLSVEEVEFIYQWAKAGEGLWGENGAYPLTARLCIGYVEMKMLVNSGERFVDWQSLLTKLKGEVKEW